MTTTEGAREMRVGARVATVFAAVLTAGSLLTACSPSGPPEGYERVQVGRALLDVPTGWSDTGELNERWTASWQDLPGSDATAQLAVAPDVGAYDAQDASGLFLASAQIGGYDDFEIVDRTLEAGGDDRDIDRIDFTYTDLDGVGREAILWAIAGGEPRRAALVQLSGSDLDAALIETVQASLDVVSE